MTHREKVDRLFTDLGAKGVNRFSIAPPVFRMLWMLGVEVPPPFFLGFVTLTLLFGLSFGVFWGVFMCLFELGRGRPVHLAIVPISIAAGLLFGLIMAVSIRRTAAKLQLPPWDAYA